MKDDLYAVALDSGGVLHGKCARRKWGEDLPEQATPVLFSDAWRRDVAGLCEECKLFVDPAEED